MFYRSICTEYLTAMPVRHYSFVKTISIYTMLSHANMKIFIRNFWEWLWISKHNTPQIQEASSIANHCCSI